ncbi:MAG: hypothetical protein RL095_2117 [Verrucomicrobiota bacterium]|jgi:ABC-type dipeptide/oligopeptide/nickel transport system permease component
MKNLWNWITGKSLGSYIAKRLLAGLVTVFFIATATFFAMHAAPGDPLRAEKGGNKEIQDNLKARYGLDKPLFVQYGLYMKNLACGDFGESFTQKNRRVNDIIADHFPVSALLGVMAMVWATLGGILWGALTALSRNRWPDTVIMLMVILGISVPGFVFASMVQLGIVHVNEFLGWSIPIAANTTAPADAGFFQKLGLMVPSLLIPSMMLGIGTMAFMTRLMRSSMLEVINSDYIRTARAKGLPPLRIFFSHQLRNAVLPLITVLGPSIAAVTTGSFVIEKIFIIPGLGKFFVEAVQQADYAVIMGTTVFYGSFLVFMVLVVDVLYGFIDPRIRVQG